jgi:hypothetical protein
MSNIEIRVSIVIISYELGGLLMNKRWTKIAFCPHCGNKTTHLLLYTHGFEGIYTFFDEEHDFEYDQEMPEQYFLAICETCKGPLLYYKHLGLDAEEDFPKGSLIWPEQKELSKKVPQKIRDYYEEAIRIKRIAPSSFAGQIRKCLEALCDARKIKKGNLLNRLEELANNGEIPKHFTEMADILRLLGNIGVHSSDTNVRSLPVDTIDDFFTAIIEYVYGFPSRIKEMKQSYKEYK